MECDEVVQSLEAYNAGELTERERASITRHLAECVGCELEREEVLALTAELRSAGGSFRTLRPFTVNDKPITSQSHSKLLAVIGVAAAVWLVLVTAAVFWPSFAQRLSFLPVGRQLSKAASSLIPGGTPAGIDAVRGGPSLSDAPQAALAAVDALFRSPEGKTHSRDGVSAQISRLLPDELTRNASSVRVVSIGPIVRLSENELRIIVAVDITHGETRRQEDSERHSFLLTVTRSVEGAWTVSNLQVPTN